jgi:hypothetical protein
MTNLRTLILDQWGDFTQQQLGVPGYQDLVFAAELHHQLKELFLAVYTFLCGIDHGV